MSMKERMRVILGLLLSLALNQAFALDAPVFFPNGTFGPSVRADDFRRTYCSQFLEFFCEHSLLAAAENGSAKESYRFLWLRTFHQPVVIRFDFAAHRSATLTRKTGSGPAGFGVPDRHIVEQQQRLLAPAETARLREALLVSQFWSIPTREHPRTLGMDGATWIMEGANGYRYHVVSRWSPCGRGGPHDTEAVCALGRTFIRDLAAIQADGRDLY
jgi:hypothetical protein